MKPKNKFSLRNTSLFTFLIGSVVFFAGCKKDSSIETLNPASSADQSSAESSQSVSALAVSTYQGFGAVTIGGTGQQVVHVTNLSSSGTGSLKAAMGSNRNIVFDVGGTISNFQWDGGNGDANNITNLTIDGSTAPSPGITLDNGNGGNCLGFEGTGNHDIIIKYLRVTNGGNDGIHFSLGAYNVIIDHCSSWGNRDGNLDITDAAHDITVQYCILGGGAPNTSGYSGTMLLGYSPKNISVHHNLFNPRSAGNVGERCPNVSDPGRSSLPNFLMADIRNNLMWKWGRNNGTGSGYATSAAYYATENCVNNYYYSTQSPTSATNMDDGYGGGSGSSKAYFAGNFSGNSGYNPNAISNTTEYAIPAAAQVTLQSPCDAANSILSQAGVRYGNVSLSATEQALINDVALVNCGATTNQPPTVNAGTDQTITLPVSSVTLTGTASDPDGTIAAYLWTKVSGTGGAITTSAAASTTITGLTAGSYVFNLKVTDNAGATASDNITVTVNPVATTNQVPVVNAGTDQTITMPVNSATLTGTASDPDGTIATYLWTKVSGTGGTITTSAAATSTITGLSAGSYVYNLKVTDNGGATASDNITVTVNPVATTNQVPVVNAGTDQTITLPVNSVTLTGTASDPDGTIAAYLWTKVSGTGGAITTSAAASTTITGLSAGSYVFNLKATDNGGATASDNITVTVNPVATTNQVPVVNAGADQMITLPVNSVTLTGTASDPDGTIVTYLWTKVSGAGGTITTSAAASTSVTGLSAGSYIFNLKVTDNAGATASDNITVTVNPAVATNRPPVVNAGTDHMITLPVNSVTLSGTASDPDGTIASYLWTKVSGAGGTITSSTTATTSVTGLTAGAYVYSLRATDNLGATATDNVTVTVNAASTGGGYGTLSFSQGYDVSSSVNTSQGLRNSVSFTTFRTGPGSFRSEVRAGDRQISGGFRSEMAYSSSSQNPTEGVVEYDVYYENWNSLQGFGHTIEWLPGTRGATALLSLQNYGGQFNVVRAIGSAITNQTGTLMNVTSNTWYKMRWEYKWSTGTDGYIRLYIDNVLYYSFTGKTTDGSGQTLKIGQARWPLSGNAIQTSSVCYYDNLKIYRK